MTQSHWTVFWLLLPGVGYLVLFFGLPLVLALLSSFGIGVIGTGASGLTLRHYGEIIETRMYSDGLQFSVYLAVASTLLSLMISMPLAVALQKTFPGKKLFSALYKIPLVVPTVVAAFLVLILLDRGGMISRLLLPFGIAMPRLVRDPWAVGVLVAMTWKAVPFMTLIISGAVASIPDDLRHAARSLGATPFSVFWRVDAPLALPGVTAATLLTFIGALGAFAIPNLLGPIYPQPLSIHMYVNAFEQNKWGLVAAMGAVLSLAACLVLVAYYRLTSGMRHAFGGDVR
jgi:putative spermidine/putrescine transport system permease protein